MHKDDVEKRINDGLVHLRVACKLYKKHISRGKFFLHEHPRLARSWDQKPVKDILKLPNVGTTVCDQCAYGLVSKTDGGEAIPAQKPTMWMSNSPAMLSELSLRCDRSHDHQHLVEGRAKPAENYPIDLVLAIVRGMSQTSEALARMRELQTDQWNTIMTMSTCNPPETTVPEDVQTIPASVLHGRDGKETVIDVYDSN